MSSWYDLSLTMLFINSFSAKGNIQVFATNTDSGESAHNKLSHLKSALFAFVQNCITWEMDTPDFEQGRVYFKQFGAERVKNIWVRIDSEADKT